MSTDLSFFRQLADSVSQAPVVVATVVQTSGSVPREVGARLLVNQTGLCAGTIGGGAGEAKVLTQAQEVLTTGHNQPVAIDLTGAPQRDIQGICGGHMQVWLERWQGEAAQSLAEHIVAALSLGQSLTLVTPLSSNLASWIDPQGAAAPPTLHLTSEVPQFRSTLQPPPTLLIVGAGHCGIQLAAVAHRVGFQVVVQDDRPAWAHQKNFPQASRISNQPIADLVEDLDQYSNLYAALVTRGFDYDLPALKALLNRPAPCHYIGMIGSQKRVRKALSAIQAQPIPPERLKALYAPIGLDLGALTPEEIAVSIVAELILVRRGGTGRSLSLGIGPHAANVAEQ
jgi:xanthine dehydrogenase accessory factor